MRTIILLSVLSFTLGNAQQEIEKNIGDFSIIKTYDLLNVELIKSDKNKVKISGHNANQVVVVQKNNKLKLKMKLPKVFQGENTKVKVFYNGSIDVIDANEGSTVTVLQPIKQYETIFKSQEGAKIKATANLNLLTVKAVSGGTVNLSGTVKKQTITINSGGVYTGKKMLSDFTKASIKAGGQGHFHCTDIIDLTVVSGGDAYIYGTPKKVNETTIIGGRVFYKKDK